MADARAASIKAGSDGRFAVTGPLTFLTARRTCAAGIEAFAGTSGEVTVDCAGVDESDSAGLAVLIEWRRWAQAQRRPLGFVNLPAAIAGLAGLCGVEGVLGDVPA